MVDDELDSGEPLELAYRNIAANEINKT